MLPPEIASQFPAAYLERFGEMNRRCRQHGVAYLTASFAAPDAARADADLRGHLETNIDFWTQGFPLPSYAGYAAIVARHNELLRDLTDRNHIARVLVDEQISDPSLFIDVCHAIHHAHHKGVIHRDINPSNVLVALYDGKPAPKVIDFGVAKTVGQPLSEQTMFTRFDRDQIDGDVARLARLHFADRPGDQASPFLELAAMIGLVEFEPGRDELLHFDIAGGSAAGVGYLEHINRMAIEITQMGPSNR